MCLSQPAQQSMGCTLAKTWKAFTRVRASALSESDRSDHIRWLYPPPADAGPGAATITSLTVTRCQMFSAISANRELSWDRGAPSCLGQSFEIGGLHSLSSSIFNSNRSLCCLQTILLCSLIMSKSWMSTFANAWCCGRQIGHGNANNNA